tara:strand:+ start:4197 stop:5864 length:1668 start_codon:yes stop_codon:yes gene_type:complete
MSKNLTALAKRQGLDNTLFQTLVVGDDAKSKAQRKALAKELLIGEAIIHGTASFYDFIEGDNANKKAYVCNGSSCLCAASQPQVTAQLLEHFSADDIGYVTCLGRCAQNSAFQINKENYSGQDIARLAEIIEFGVIDSAESYHVETNLKPAVLTAEIEHVGQYYQVFTEVTGKFSRDELLQQLTDSGLRGRGGAGFPTGFKWRSCRDAKGEEKYIVCNADEGDAGAFSDRYLLEQRPHSVLFGMLMAGYLAGAETGVLYIRDEYPQAIRATEKAIIEFQALGLLDNLAFSFDFKIIRGAGAYICGEETALLRSIEGQRPLVSVRPPFPTESGLFGCPTILNNVETFAAINFIFSVGAESFFALGNGKSTGSKLVSLDGSFNKPGIYEVVMGMELTALIEMAGGFAKPLKALHIGGPLGGVVPLSALEKLTLDYESFAENGFLLGHASVIGLPASLAMIDYIEHLFEFTAAESCGKCYPCKLGSVRGQEMIQAAISGKQLLNRQLLDDLLETMQFGSLCALGGGVPLPIENILQYFADEIRPYIKQTNTTLEQANG